MQRRKSGIKTIAKPTLGVMQYTVRNAKAVRLIYLSRLTWLIQITTFSRMGLKRYAGLILLLVALVQFGYSQQSKSLLRIESDGLSGSQIKETSRGKLVNVLASGGYITVHAADLVDKLPNPLYYRSYYRKVGSTPNANNLPSIPVLNCGPVYLSPDMEVFVDAIDLKADTLVRKYAIKRPKLVPEAKFYRPGDDDTFYTLTTAGRPERLSMNPGELIIKFDERDDFKNLEVEYRLKNQKTGRSQSGITKLRSVSVMLEENAVYELRVNYEAQNETERSVVLFVKPYWYKSPKTYILLSVFVVAAGFIWMMWFFKNKLRSSTTKQQKLEQAAIRLQSLLNPHFTFNALSSIQGLMNTDRIEEANQYLQEFSSLLRKTLAKSQHVFNNLDQELEMMRMYLRLEALRFNFTWDIEIAPEVDLSGIEIPTLILQPLIENAIKHGLSGLGDKGKLLIVCRQGQKAGSFVIVVKDNGTWVDKQSDSGYGLSLTAERIVTINKIMEGQTITLEFDKRWGTAAILTFNNWIDN